MGVRVYQGERTEKGLSSRGACCGLPGEIPVMTPHFRSQGQVRDVGDLEDDVDGRREENMSYEDKKS